MFFHHNHVCRYVFKPTFMVLVILGLTIPSFARAGEAGAVAGSGAEVSIDVRQQRGRHMMRVGLAVQGVGLGLAGGGLIGEAAGGAMFAPINYAYDGTSAAFAPVAATGFRFALSDGTRRGELKATSTGLFEGAAYSGLLAGVWGLRMAIAFNQENSLCEQEPDNMNCHEGPGPGMWMGPPMVIHLAVTTAMLIPAIITGVASRSAGDQAVADGTLAPPVIAPMPLREGGGFALSFRF